MLTNDPLRPSLNRRIRIHSHADPLYGLLNVGSKADELLPVLYRATPELLRRYSVMSGLPMHITGNGRPVGVGLGGTVGRAPIIRGGVYAKVVFWVTTGIVAGSVG